MKVVVDHVSAQGPTATHMRGILLVNSLENLKEVGLFERYLAALSPMHHEAVQFALASSWVPMDVVLAHYHACDDLTLDDREVQKLGALSATRVAETLLSAIMRTTRNLGVESFWSALEQNGRYWDRMWLGGGVTILQAGPKDVIIENHGLPVVQSPFWRNAYQAYWRALGNAFTRVAYVRVTRPREPHPHRIAIAGSWV